MRVAIAGGNGFIGRELTVQLLAAGHDVTWLSHRPGRVTPPQGAREVSFDPLGGRDSEWASAVRSAHGVVNLSGYPIATYWTRRRRRLLASSRIETTNALVREMVCGSVDGRRQVLVGASAVGIYGEAYERLLTESSPLGDDFLATIAVDWEDAACAAEQSGCRVVTIRNGIVLGKEGILPRMLLPTRLYLGGPIGSGRQWLSWVHIADIAGLYRFALERDDISGALNAGAPSPVRMSEFSATLGRVVHRPSWLAVPPLALEVVLGDVARYMLMSQRMSADKALASGYVFQFPELQPALENLVLRPVPAETTAPPEPVPAPDVTEPALQQQEEPALGVVDAASEQTHAESGSEAPGADREVKSESPPDPTEPAGPATLEPAPETAEPQAAAVPSGDAAIVLEPHFSQPAE